MKLIIAGTRTAQVSVEQMDDVLKAYGLRPTEVVSGGSRGVDQCGEEWARSNNIPVQVFPAFWTRFGNSAGPRRNAEMAEYADHLIVFWDGKSPGTSSMVREMKKRDKPITIVDWDISPKATRPRLGPLGYAKYRTSPRREGDSGWLYEYYRGLRIIYKAYGKPGNPRHRLGLKNQKGFDHLPKNQVEGRKRKRRRVLVTRILGITQDEMRDMLPADQQKLGHSNKRR